MMSMMPQIAVRVTEAERRKIHMQAIQQGLSVSNYTRKLWGLEPVETGGAAHKRNVTAKARKVKR
jgi:hypothetical protein